MNPLITIMTCFVVFGYIFARDSKLPRLLAGFHVGIFPKTVTSAAICITRNSIIKEPPSLSRRSAGGRSL